MSGLGSDLTSFQASEGHLKEYSIKGRSMDLENSSSSEPVNNEQHLNCPKRPPSEFTSNSSLLRPPIAAIPAVDIDEIPCEAGKTIKFANTDFEITIPAPIVIFTTQNSQSDLNSSISSTSPHFLEQSVSFHSSPRSSVNLSDNHVVDSPISVIRIPYGTRQFSEFPKKAAKKAKEVEMVTCEICQRNIKKRSYKAHLMTKIHLSNLRAGY